MRHHLDPTICRPHMSSQSGIMTSIFLLYPMLISVSVWVFSVSHSSLIIGVKTVACCHHNFDPPTTWQTHVSSIFYLFLEFNGETKLTNTPTLTPTLTLPRTSATSSSPNTPHLFSTSAPSSWNYHRNIYIYIYYFKIRGEMTGFDASRVFDCL